MALAKVQWCPTAGKVSQWLCVIGIVLYPPCELNGITVMSSNPPTTKNSMVHSIVYVSTYYQLNTVKFNSVNSNAKLLDKVTSTQCQPWLLPADRDSDSCTMSSVFDTTSRSPSRELSSTTSLPLIDNKHSRTNCYSTICSFSINQFIAISFHWNHSAVSTTSLCDTLK